MNRSISELAVLALMVGACGQAEATIIADSVSEFSGTQGANGWYYGYYDGSLAPSTFKLMPTYDPNSVGSTERGGGGLFPPGMWSVQWDASGYWTCLETKGGIPNGTDGNWGRQQNEQWAVRRWVSDVSGPITISGLAAPMQSPNDDLRVRRWQRGFWAAGALVRNPLQLRHYGISGIDRRFCHCTF